MERYAIKCRFVPIDDLLQIAMIVLDGGTVGHGAFRAAQHTGPYRVSIALTVGHSDDGSAVDATH